MRTDVLVKVAVLALAASPASAQSALPAWAPVSATTVFVTGDSWVDHGVTFRLYGVQACLRGTIFTNAHGQKRDCGEASLAMLVALIRDLHPQCLPATAAPSSSTTFVVCIAQPSTGAAAGSRLDLGTALIATGFAFAALGPDGRPVHAPYAVAEQVARQSRAGLWAFADLPDPNVLIRRLLAGRSPPTRTPMAASQSSPSPEPLPSGDDHP